MQEELHKIAREAFQCLMQAGFDDAQVVAKMEDCNELEVVNNKPSLFRTTSLPKLQLKGIVDHRKATTGLPFIGLQRLKTVAEDLFLQAKSTPQDEAVFVSEEQEHTFSQGPKEADKSLMVERIQELFAFRESETPSTNISQGGLQHKHRQSVLLSSRGSHLSADHGWYETILMAVGKRGDQTSSLNYSFGSMFSISNPLVESFGFRALLEEAPKQIQTVKVPEPFTGSVLMTPGAALTFISFLDKQLRGKALLSKTSLFMEQLGQAVASPLFNVFHHATAPGHAPHSSDGYMIEDFPILRDGTLLALLADRYISRKCHITHRPSGDCFSVQNGSLRKNDLLSNIERGALVGRLSMGSPGANGDFSGVIKNSFLVEKGRRGDALSETMISGNVAQMLKDIDGISVEQIDFGAYSTPFIRIPNLVFS